MKLVLELVTGSAGPGAFGTPALDHEIRDHAVKGQAIIKVLGAQRLKVPDGLGCFVVEQLDTNFSLGGFEISDFHKGLILEEVNGKIPSPLHKRGIISVPRLRSGLLCPRLRSGLL